MHQLLVKTFNSPINVFRCMLHSVYYINCFVVSATKGNKID